MSNLFLNQQVIFITGASAGIGSALALELAQSYPGVRLILSSRLTSTSKLESLAQQCTALGAEIHCLYADLSDEQQVKDLADKALSLFGSIDILVNNAGYGQMGPIELLSVDYAKQQFAVNFFAPYILAKAVIPSMRNQGRGRIINVSSLGGRMAFPSGGLYSSSKFALEALSDVLRMELQGFNIQVSVIEPGPVMTDFFAVVKEKIDQAIPNPENTPYRALFSTFEQLETQVKQLGWTGEKTAKRMIKSMTDYPAKPRYVLATGGTVLICLMTKLFPTWMSDLFWKKFYGVDRVEKDWKNRSQS